MSKELYELTRIENNIIYLLSDCSDYDELVECFKSVEEHKSCEIIRNALQRLESIDKANFSEALKKLKENTEMFDEIAKENDHTYKEDTVIEAYVYHFNNIVIEQALLKAQETEKANARNEEILQKYYQEGITLDSVRALKKEKDNYKRALEAIKEKKVITWN